MKIWNTLQNLSVVKVMSECVNVKSYFLPNKGVRERCVLSAARGKERWHYSLYVCTLQESTWKEGYESSPEYISAEQPIASVFEGKVQWRGKQKLCAIVSQE